MHNEHHETPVTDETRKYFNWRNELIPGKWGDHYNGGRPLPSGVFKDEQGQHARSSNRVELENGEQFGE